MVSTRKHPSEFPEPDTSSSPSSTPTKPPPSSSSSTSKPPSTSKPHPTTTTTALTPRPKSSTASTLHTPTRLTTLWLLISLPLVIWDFTYVFLRPHSMPGGSLHSPLWIPYSTYGSVDYTYGFPAWEANNGFTAAQSSLNLAETGMYAFYLVVVWRNGRVARGGKRGLRWLVWEEKRVESAGLAVLVMFAASVMTVSKTWLYVFNEVFSGFDNIGHNTFLSLIPLWIIPNGAWIVVPSFMVYDFGREILAALEVAAAAAPGGGSSKRK
ncbi:MAG: hypothetical protein Q9160_005750 [Pyrenula sp. 1 TL-2023]